MVYSVLDGCSHSGLVSASTYQRILGENSQDDLAERVARLERERPSSYRSN